MFHKILIPVDTESVALAKYAINIAISLCRTDHEKLRIINVHPILPLNITSYLPPNFDEKMRKNAEKAFAEFYSKLSYTSETFSKTIKYGTVYREVIAEAQDWGADLIVVGSHQPGIASQLLGSNASSIVLHATCSVLVVRQQILLT